MFASRRLLTIAVVLGAGAGVLAQGSESAPAKQKPGIYVAAPGKGGADALTKLSGSRPKEVKQTGMLKMVLSQGIAKGSFRAELGGPISDVRVAGAAKFYFYFATADDKDKAKSSDDPMAAAMAMMNQGGTDSLPADAKTAGDFTLVRFTLNKSNNREAEVGKMSATGSSESRDAIACTSERLAQGQYVLTPKEPLKPGEYAFYFSSNAGGGGGAATTTMWDFGIDK
jgi:hypothetical protein